MQSGPQKTDTSKFKGLSFGLGKPVAGTTPGAKAKPAPGLNVFAGGGASKSTPASTSKVASLFQASMDDESAGGSRSSLPNWSKPTAEAIKAQRHAEVMMASDPTVFQYDEILDDMKEENGQEKVQAVRTDVLLQKKRVGLTVTAGADDVKNGSKRPAKYIEQVLIATDRRRVEQQVIEDRLLKKEKEARKDCEVFVTEAFKEELKKRKKFEDELEQQDMKDKFRAADKQENGLGFAEMYRNLLNGGLASSRGGEKVKELALARVELPKEEVKDEVKEEDVDEAKLKTKLEGVKDEDMTEGPSLGVQDVSAPASASEKAQKAAEEHGQRVEKAMSAKERFLMRKKMEQADGSAVS